MVFWIARGESLTNPRRGTFRPVEWRVWQGVFGSADGVFGARFVLVCPD